MTMSNETQFNLPFVKDNLDLKTTQDIERHLQGILQNTESGVYHGGSLCIGVDGKDYIINIGDDKTSATIRKLAAQIYLRHKGRHHAYWELAHKLCS